MIHAGTGLARLRQLVIIKHSDTFITAYAHNQALLVKEDQVVRKGQKIAEMGNTESETVKLHFEDPQCRASRLTRPFAAACAPKDSSTMPGSVSAPATTGSAVHPRPRA